MWDQIPFLETREEQDIAVDQGDETPSSEQNQQQVSREKSDEVPTSTSSRSLISSTSSASPILSSGGVSNELAHGALGIQSPSGGEDSDTEARFRRSLELTATWQYGEHAQKALSNGKRDTEQEDFGSGGESQDSSRNDVDECVDAESQSQGSLGLRSDYGHAPCTLDQELALPSITSDDSSSQRFGVASPGVSQASGYDLCRWDSLGKKKSSRGVPTNETLTKQNFPDGPAGNSKWGRAPEVPPLPNPSDPAAVGEQIDCRSKEKGKENDQELSPSTAFLVTSRDIGKQRGSPGRRSGKVSSPDTGTPSSGHSPTSGRSTLSATSPTETYAGRNRRAPLFLLLTDEDAHFAPFSGEGAPRPGESRTDIMIRDQIARCEAIRGQRLSDGEKEVIRSYYRQMNRRHAPCEVSEPSIVRSAAEPTKLEVLGRRSGLSSESGGSSNHGNHGRSSPVTSGDLPAGAQNDEYAGDSNNTVELSELLGMIQDLKTRLKETQSHLMRERQETERRLEKLEKGHQDVMAVLNELRIGRSGSDPGGAVYTHVLSGQAMRANGLGFNPTLAVVALAAMVWLVTEAMLHSKRLSDGYGPFINGGYNGLASVVVFGTWTQFTFFITASTYLGVVSVLGALRR